MKIIIRLILLLNIGILNVYADDELDLLDKTNRTIIYKKEFFKLKQIPYYYWPTIIYIPGMYREPCTWCHDGYDLHIYPNGKYIITHSGDMLKTEPLALGTWKYTENGNVVFLEKAKNKYVKFGDLKHFFKLSDQSKIINAYVINNNEKVGETILAIENSEKNRKENIEKDFLVRLVPYNNWPEQQLEYEELIYKK